MNDLKKATEIIHTDPENFKDPLVLNPERFLQKKNYPDETVLHPLHSLHSVQVLGIALDKKLL